MEAVAQRTTNLLYERLRDTGAPSCVLARLFATVPFHALEPAQQDFVRTLQPDVGSRPATRCLTLLGTTGAEAPWNSRHTSAAHKALPLSSTASIARSPMISQLIRQLGMDAASLVEPVSGVMVDYAQHTFNVFHVPTALGSPHIPAQQEFVVPHQVQSVLGFGGLLPPGELFATILFSRVQIPRETAELFKTLALNVKVALLPFAGGRIFS